LLSKYKNVVINTFLYQGKLHEIKKSPTIFVVRDTE